MNGYLDIKACHMVQACAGLCRLLLPSEWTGPVFYWALLVKELVVTAGFLWWLLLYLCFFDGLRWSLQKDPLTQRGRHRFAENHWTNLP